MTGMQWTWTGRDGSAWDLTAGRVRLDKRPVGGVGEPEWVRSVRSSAGQSGQRRTAWSTAKARAGFLPFFLAETEPAARVATEAAWWASWDVDFPGTLTITQPDGSSRSIAACLQDDADYEPAKDPYTRPTDKLAVNWVADDPWWRGPAVVRTFGQQASQNFFGTRYGPPFFISSSNILATATLTNSGDIDAPVLITVMGPATGFDFTISGHRVAGSIPVVAGASLLLDSDVRHLSATSLATDGTRTDVTRQLAVADFARIPRKSTVPLTAQLTGSGSVTVRHEPRYRRAWG